VAVLGASNYTYIEATWSQQLPDWIGSHVRALDFFGGVTELWVPDNLRRGVSKASHYEPDINPTYHDLASHYEVAVLPARARKPKDKAKVENGVLVVERWVLARLRHQRFFSLNELNRSLRTLLVDLNQRPFKKLPGSRASAFADMDQPALRALPLRAYEYAEWKLARRRRLPRRGRRPLLLGAVPACAQAGQRTHHGHHSRGLPSRHTPEQPPAQHVQRPAYDDR
jgi:hypothetical protein